MSATRLVACHKPAFASLPPDGSHLDTPDFNSPLSHSSLATKSCVSSPILIGRDSQNDNPPDQDLLNER